MLKGEAKKTYQREYMRGYMKRLRLKGRLLRPPTSKSVKTPDSIITPEIRAILDKPAVMPGFIARLNRGEVSIDADGNVIYEEG